MAYLRPCEESPSQANCIHQVQVTFPVHLAGIVYFANDISRVEPLACHKHRRVWSHEDILSQVALLEQPLKTDRQDLAVLKHDRLSQIGVLAQAARLGYCVDQGCGIAKLDNSRSFDRSEDRNPSAVDFVDDHVDQRVGDEQRLAFILTLRNIKNRILENTCYSA